MVGTAVDHVRAEMALERRYHHRGRLVIHSGGLYPIAIPPERLLQAGDRVAAVAGAERRRGRRLGGDPGADAGAVQPLPREFLAGIVLALRGDVGMPEHPVRPDAVAMQDVAAESDYRIDLGVREIGAAEIMAGI